MGRYSVDTGNSGFFLSSNYFDMNQDHLKGNLAVIEVDRNEIEKKSVSKMVLSQKHGEKWKKAVNDL